MSESPAIGTSRGFESGYALRCEGITKAFEGLVAVNGAAFDVPRGLITALIGPNGAGKTTFVRLVATLLHPDAGLLRVAGLDTRVDPRRVRRVIGLAGQSASVEPAMTGKENLEFVGRLFGLGRRDARAAAASVLEQLDLTDAADRLVRTYSGGMRRRLDLGASLVGHPKLLLLDEPTSGLDPRGRIELWDAIGHLVAAGTDVLLTTQYLDEADRLARSIVIIDHGRVIAAGTPEQLKMRTGGEVLVIRARNSADLPAVEEALHSVSGGAPRIEIETSTATVPVERGAEQLVAAARLLDERHIQLDDIALRRPSLDDVFLSLTGQPTASAAGDAHPAGELQAAS
ncbi:MAG TPA: ATP-binding cassette domain-containing protein [Gaiellaceae bacterium]|nr:ATP-binding cassette domain-containing protein [Gaiellaceae bacterium]